MACMISGLRMEEANTLVHFLLKLLMQKSMNGKIEFGRYYMNNPIGIILLC